jgi:ABC-type branched-subunit amino acid transport system substrate-binding protein
MGDGRGLRRAGLVLILGALLGGCVLPGNAAPVVKLGLIGPFEGAGREVGYAVLPAVKAVVAEANASGDLGAYRVALAVVNDSNDPAAAEREARALAAHPDVLAIIGPFTGETAAAVASVSLARGIPWIPAAGSPDGDPADEINLATHAARRALAALSADILRNGRPSRAGVQAFLQSAP